MPGRWTLTATGSPLCRTARWTWPIEAAANEAWLNERKTVSGSAPSSSVMIAADIVVRERLDLVEELEQLVAVGRRQQVEAKGEHLAQLDPRATQALEGQAQPDRAGAPIAAGQVEGRCDEEGEEDGEDVPDPARVPEQRSHVALSRSAAMAHRRSRGRDTSATRSHGRSWGRSGSSSSMETRRRRVGREVSSSHSRPARTSSASVRRENRYIRATAPSAASWPSRPRRIPRRTLSVSIASPSSNVSARRRWRRRRA